MDQLEKSFPTAALITHGAIDGLVLGSSETFKIKGYPSEPRLIWSCTFHWRRPPIDQVLDSGLYHPDDTPLIPSPLFPLVGMTNSLSFLPLILPLSLPAKAIDPVHSANALAQITEDPPEPGTE